MRKGFTLIETVVAVGIIAVIIFIGAFSFRASSQAVKINQTQELGKEVLFQIVQYARVKGKLPSSTNDLSSYVQNLPEDPMSSPMPSKWAWDGTYVYAVKADGSKTLPKKLSDVFPFFDSYTSYYGSYKSKEEPYSYLSPSGLVRNGGFEKAEQYWYAYNGGDYIAVKGIEPVLSGTKALAIQGDLHANRGCRQKINISGKAGDEYTVVYHSYPSGVTQTSWYGCEVYFHYKNGTHSYQGQWHPNKYLQEWQEGVVTVKAGKDYDYMYVYLIFYKADGTAYFDDIQITKK